MTQAPIQAHFRKGWQDFTLDVDLQLPGKGITALFGHSGSGKTTLLRCFAGLGSRPQGRCLVNGEVWQDEHQFLPPHRRAIGYVFQDANLFPHLNVLKNLRYGQSRSRSAPATPHGTLRIAGIAASSTIRLVSPQAATSAHT